MIAQRWSRQDDYDAVLYRAAGAHGITPPLLKALVAAESAFNPRAYREEPPKASLPPTPDYPNGGDASYGLTQVLSRTARGMGYTGVLSGLFDVGTNLTLGATYLGQQLARYSGDIAKAVAAYNAGSARYTSGGAFINQVYVDRVLGYLDYFRQYEAGKGAVPGPTQPAPSFPESDGDLPEPRDAVPGGDGGSGRPDPQSAPTMTMPWLATGAGVLIWAVILWGWWTANGSCGLGR